MKVFAYNIETGVKGNDVLGDINCCSYGSYGLTLPEVKFPSNINKDSNWNIAGKASNKQDKEILPSHFGQTAICFCTGEFRCGTDISWEWVILVNPI